MQRYICAAHCIGKGLSGEKYKVHRPLCKQWLKQQMVSVCMNPPSCSLNKNIFAHCMSVRLMFISASHKIRLDFLQSYKCAMTLHQEGLKRPDMQLEELTGY